MPLLMQEVPMTSMNISVPDLMRQWVQSRIESGSYASVSDYVRDLIRRDQSANADREKRLTALDASIARGIADADAGRVHDVDEVCDELDAKYARMAAERGSL
jgi:antitoxin ParD1/3/4